VILFNGGADTQTVISRGGVEIVSSAGVSNEATLRSGGVEIVLSGGTAQNTIIDKGGTLVLLPGAADPGILRLAGGKVDTTGVVLVNPDSAAAIYAGSISGLAVQAGGNAYVLAGGTAESAQLNGSYTEFATMTVFAGGHAAATAINSGGEVFVQTGARDYGAEVASGGYLYLAGTGSEDALNAGGTMFLQSGGVAFGTDINGGARQFDGPGGQALAANVADGAVQIVSGGIAFGTEIVSGGSQYVDSGGVAYQSVDAGEEILSSGAAGDGATLTNGMLILSGGSEFTGTLEFSNFGGTLVIDMAIPTAAEIANFGQSDTIALNQLAYDPANLPEVLNPGTLIVAPGISLDIAGALSGAQFAFVDNDGETEITAAVPCFAEGSRILTPAGEVEVERLNVGDRVITEAGEDAPIIWIGRRTILLAEHPEPATAQPIRIAAHSFGHGLPVRDLLLSPDHAVLCEGVLVPAKALVNGANITQLKRRRVTYYHVELAAHSIIFAENLAVESFLDTGNRQGFENVAPGPARPYAEALAMRLRDSCAPVAEAGAHVVTARHAAARRHLKKQAVAL
jgi:autotransporter passenger strand-loop-strand repeat protein